jgi:DNA-binding beta-propeller fold protein YncE
MRSDRGAALAVVLSVLIGLPAASECGAQVFLFEWGQSGSGAGQFNSPSGIAVDSAGNVYVADTANHRIQKFDDQGTFLLKWGSAGSGAGQFNSPQGVAVGSADHVFVVDSGNHRIQKFGPNEGFVTAWGAAGTGPGQFDQPFGIAADSQDNLYVTDSGNDRVQKFDPDGVFLTGWGSTGAGPGEFQGPRAITAMVTAGDRVYVADAVNRIQVFESSGEYVMEFGGAGQAEARFKGLDGMGVTDGLLVVGDTGNHRVQQVHFDGGFVTTWGIFGRDEGRFNRPAGIAGAEGVVYAVDSGNSRIQAFGPPLPPIYNLDFSLGYNLSRTNNRQVESGGLSCSLPSDTIQNVYWAYAYGMTFVGGQYSGYVSGVSMVLTMRYAGEQRDRFEEVDLAMESNSRAVGTIHVVEVDSNGNYCTYEGDAVLQGTPLVQTVTPVTPVQGGGALLGDNIGGGAGGCFIKSLLR